MFRPLYIRASSLSLCLALGALLTLGCDDKVSKDSPLEVGGEAGAEVGGEVGGHMGGAQGGEVGGHMGGEASPPNAPLSGDYYMSLYLAEFSLIMPFKLTFVAGVDQFDRVTISAVNGEMISEPMKVVEAVPVPEDQRFEVDFGEATLPGPFSPTSTDVVINLKLIVEELRERTFCGQIRGDVVTFETPVLMSTFAAYPWGEEGEEPASACVEEALSFDPITACPELTDGLNEAFPSAELERSLKLVLPDGYDAEQSYPLLFAYHGLGGSIEDFLEQNTLDAATRAGGVILVVPSSQGLGAEWESGLYGPTRDLAFFDDMLTCVQEQYSVDPAQVHVTGHSAGTFFGAALSLQRDQVLASTALVSAGMSVDYRAPERKRPFFFLWGGPEDSAYDQDFDLQTRNLIDTFSSEGHPVVFCDHSPLELIGDDSRHSWPDLVSTWVVDFLLAHPQDVSPLPYAEGAPEAWTGDCEVR